LDLLLGVFLSPDWIPSSALEDDWSMNTLECIGYWGGSGLLGFYPMPSQFIRDWDPVLKSNVLSNMRNATVIARWMGYATCRFRHGPPPEVMGDSDYCDGVWMWPQGLDVYVDLFDVGLPEEFISHMKMANFLPTRGHDREQLWKLERSTAFWEEWCRKNGENRFVALLKLYFCRPRSSR
jgi:hypothetical protein